MLFFTTSNLKSAKVFESRRVLLWSKTIYSGISSYCTFHILCTILSTLNFNTVLSMFLFLFYWSHLKAVAVHFSDSSLFCKRSIMSQLNIQAATAENQEEYTLSNLMYIVFQNSSIDQTIEKYLLWSLSLDKVEDWGPVTLPKKHSFNPLSFFKGFRWDLYSFNICWHFRNTFIFQNTFNRCKVFKIFISTKLYIQDWKLGAKKTGNA